MLHSEDRGTMYFLKLCSLGLEKDQHRGHPDAGAHPCSGVQQGGQLGLEWFEKGFRLAAVQVLVAFLGCCYGT